MTGEELGPVAQQVLFQHQGRELRSANEKNKPALVLDPAQFLPDLDKAMIAQQLPFYPLKACPVSGKDLGSMGDPRQIVFRNCLVQLCCAMGEPVPFVAGNRMIKMCRAGCAKKDS